MVDRIEQIADVPRKPEPAAAYLMDLLEAASFLANAADLPNSSALLAAAVQLVDQECRLVTGRSPKRG